MTAPGRHPTSDGTGPSGTGDDTADWIDELELVDHHCHAVVGTDLDRPAFEQLLGESGRAAPAGCSAFDTNLGLAVRAWCAPVLDLPRGASAADYVQRRLTLGAAEVNARFLALGARELLVDTGYRSDELVSLEQLGRWTGGPVHEIARLETIAEEVVAALRRRGARPSAAAEVYAEVFAAAVAERTSAVGWKSVAAYRCGLDIDWSRPTPAEVRAAAHEWLGAGPGGGGAAPGRLAHPVLIRHGVWTAIDTGRPVQFHTGFGDTDARLPGSDPTHLSGLIAACAGTGTSIMLLHCWPRHREAGYLAQMWPHVHLDIGETIPHVGHRASAVLAETLELAPWHKVLYSSDAFGLAELFHLGARLHRRALATALAPLAEMGLDGPRAGAPGQPGHERERPPRLPGPGDAGRPGRGVSYYRPVIRPYRQLDIPPPVMAPQELNDFLSQAFPPSGDGFEVVEVTATGTVVRLPIGAEHQRPGGTVSGPTMMKLADGAAWMATLSRIGPVAMAVTSSLNIHFLRKPSLAADLWAEAELVRLGRRLSVTEVNLLSAGSGDLVAHATVTYAIPSAAPPDSAIPRSPLRLPP